MPVPHTETHVNRASGSRGLSPSLANGIWWPVVVVVALGVVIDLRARGGTARSPSEGAGVPLQGTTLADAQRHFYNARYDAAAALALALRSSETQDLANDELRTSALLFQLKRLLEGPPGTDPDKIDKKAALRNCATCPELIDAFDSDIRHGQNLARAILRTDPADETALFFLGKLDLNYVWLQLGPLGRRTGWGEYWEARRSLDAVLKKHPQHVRALVARAWIDYIVDTKMKWGTRWLLGGGSRKRALAAAQRASLIESDFFSHAEAEFALWNMRVRERDLTQATEVAQRLVRDFPDNRELVVFLEARESSGRR